ncbi:unnamed protein product [Thelazia callipaeda]|uniref:DNA helicase n=1 Tax=Thelazia callipaeda TaxID=103827 RepID=A0A0N5D280_THECL|nr:unnamed protein product [Thelazia callipaeda]
MLETGIESDTQIEMPEDVQMITQRQLAFMKNIKLKRIHMNLVKMIHPTVEHVTLSPEPPKEIAIASDYDETMLKHLRKIKDLK